MIVGSMPWRVALKPPASRSPAFSRASAALRSGSTRPDIQRSCSATTNRHHKPCFTLTSRASPSSEMSRSSSLYLPSTSARRASRARTSARRGERPGSVARTPVSFAKSSGLHLTATFAGSCWRTCRSCSNSTGARRCGTSRARLRRSSSRGRTAWWTRGCSGCLRGASESILLASRTEDPRTILFAGDEGEPALPDGISAAFLRKLKGVGRRTVRIPEGVVGSRVPTLSLDLPADWGLASPSARASGQVSLTVPPWPTVAAPGLSSAWTAASGESGER